jgi:hypothetical protein
MNLCAVILVIGGILMGTNNLQDNTYLGIVVFSSLFLLFVDVVAAYYVVCMRLLV